jgi:hypothetical protein
MACGRPLLLSTAALFLALALACGKGDDTAPEDLPEGVWQDASCGLTWEPDIGLIDHWAEGAAHCGSLELGDRAWRLPTIGELRCLVDGCDGTVPGGDCEVGDDCTDLGCVTTACQGCDLDAGPSGGCYWPEQLGGACGDPLWSATPGDEKRAWLIDFREGSIDQDEITERHGVLCVLDG